MDNLPLRLRFRAWWEGYELADLARILARRAEAGAAETEELQPVTSRAAEPIDRRASGQPAPAPRPSALADAGWKPEQIAAGEIVFGERSLSPRCEDQLKAISSEAGLGPASQIVHLGAELGGIAILLERGLGCTVAAAESLPVLVAASGGRVMPLNANEGPKLGKTDFILVDGLGERGEPITTLLRNQCAGLVPGGRLVMRTLVLADDRAAGSARYRDWADGEPVRPRLRSVDELTRILQEARLTVIDSKPMADTYAHEVEYCWGNAIDRIRELHRDPTGRTVLPTLLLECERWRRRIELIRDGVIGVQQITARRRERGRI